MDKEFDGAYKALNAEQKRAVDAISGPLFVMAGPGTGKTELLALRATNILRKDTTMLPSNILCLTFTDNASDNMRRRLTKYIGQDAYQVAIHTFNSFGQYVMNAHPEYFYEWREMQTADELSSHRILEVTLESLPGSHMLAARGWDGVYYAMKQLKNFISDAKKNNLTPAEILKILDQNQQTYAQITPLVQDFWPATMNDKTAIEKIGGFLDAVAKIKPDKPPVGGILPEKTMIVESLDRAAAESEQLEGRAKTKPFTAWKEDWLEKDATNDWVFKAESHIEKLRVATDIYTKYQQALEAKGQADFNDQIMWVLRTMDAQDQLRYNLQERFQYVMIDEFQDTNRAQLLLAQHITDAPVHEGKPNIMVVGDDDQAIFRFQGADIGNVEEFEKRYSQIERVFLVKNYRSSQEILDAARQVSRQIKFSLENQKQLTKQLVATVEKQGRGVTLNEFKNDSDHYSWVAKQIKQLVKSGVKGKEIAVLARQRNHLDSLVPYLRGAVAIDYERRENVLEQRHVVGLLQLARLVGHIGQQQLAEANALMPSILSEPMWGIAAVDIWQVSQEAYSQKKFWLDVIFEQKGTRLRQIADFFVELGNASTTLPAEQVLDRLVGTQTDDIAAKFKSPFKDYYFGDELLNNQPSEYLTLLSHLSTLRRHLRKYQANQNRVLTIKDLVEFADSYTRTETLRMLDTSPHREDDNAVKLMTVHKAKGLEFDHVFVIALQNDSWTKTGRSNRFGYPTNLEVIKPTDNDADDALRLLFVAMTRARHSLELAYFLKNEDGKAEQPYGPLLALALEPSRPKVQTNANELAEQYEQRWLTKHASVSKADMRPYLDEKLSRYQLSATHLNDFLDVSNGGPMYFLVQDLLRFPSAKAPHASYGSAMHSAMSEAHEQIIQGESLDSEKVIAKFEEVLAIQSLDKRDLEYFAKEGPETLLFYLEKEAASFDKSQKVDVTFANQGVVVGDARLKGNIDRMDFDPNKKTIILSDYKTGSPQSKWELPPSAKEYERIKMHRYKNQLKFYKLLVDESTDWGKHGWKADMGYLRFLKKNQYGKLGNVPLVYDASEMKEFKRLVQAVWQHIQSLDWPDTSKYPPSLKGTVQFEKDLTS
ncbi:MAG: ATP-dependent DNA helicase [bacterium]|nr:ATP-dependent DNA helicase [bacterium]